MRDLAVREMPHSGKPDELVDAFGISARHVWRRCAQFHSTFPGAPRRLGKGKQGWAIAGFWNFTCHLPWGRGLS
jgi:hypothetical protein